MNRNVQIIIPAVLLGLAIAATVWWFITGAELEKYAVDADVPCPYRWAEQRDGSYRFTVNTEKYPEHDWLIEGSYAGSLTVTEDKVTKTQRSYTITPLQSGVNYVRFACEKATPFPDRVFTVALSIVVDEDLSVTIANTEHTVLEGIHSGAEDSDFPYRWWVDGSDLHIAITDTIGYRWGTDYDVEQLQVTEPFYREGSCGFTVQGLTAGRHTLLLYHNDGFALYVDIVVDDSLLPTIVSDRTGSIVPPDRDLTELEAKVGTVTIPAGAKISENWVNSDSVGIRLTMDEQEWSYLLSKERSLRDFSSRDAGWAEVTKEESDGGYTFTAYVYSNGVAVYWKDSEGRSCGLRGKRMAPETAIAVAKQFAGVGNG